MECWGAAAGLRSEEQSSAAGFDSSLQHGTHTGPADRHAHILLHTQWTVTISSTLKTIKEPEDMIKKVRWGFYILFMKPEFVTQRDVFERKKLRQTNTKHFMLQKCKVFPYFTTLFFLCVFTSTLHKEFERVEGTIDQVWAIWRWWLKVWRFIRPCLSKSRIQGSITVQRLRLPRCDAGSRFILAFSLAGMGSRGPA